MVSLLDLFDGRRQLILYRAFYVPEVTTYLRAARTRRGRAWTARSSRTGRTRGPPERRNTTLVFASRAPRPRSRA